MAAAGNLNPVTVAKLLQAPGINVNLRNSVSACMSNEKQWFAVFGVTGSLVLQEHRTALMIAAANGDPESVKAFLLHQHAVDIDATDNVSLLS